MLTFEIKQFLRRRFPPKEWSLFFEVSEGVGKIGSRCDAVVVGHAPHNRGYIVGFKIKAFRSDWLKELAQPRKNKFWVQACNEFYVVAEQYNDWKCRKSTGIVKIEELPEGWGLIDPTLSRRSMVKRATRKEAKLTLELMIYLLRSAAFCRNKLDSIMAIIQWKDIYTLQEKTNRELCKFSEEAESLFSELEEEGVNK